LFMGGLAATLLLGVSAREVLESWSIGVMD